MLKIHKIYLFIQKYSWGIPKRRRWSRVVVLLASVYTLALLGHLPSFWKSKSSKIPSQLKINQNTTNYVPEASNHHSDEVNPSEQNEYANSDSASEEVTLNFTYMTPPVPPLFDLININSSNGAWKLDAKQPHAGHIIDAYLCEALEASIFKGKSVLDLGAGIGLYGRFFLRKKEVMYPDLPEVEKYFFESLLELEPWWRNSTPRVKSWTGYDGSPNIENITGGFVKHLDLTKPQNLSQKFDWVLSLEVGEHIAKQHQATFISNLVNHIKEGLVLSWAVRGQTGDGHVNNLNSNEVVGLMAKQGFVPLKDMWRYFRKRARFRWLTHSIMVFAPGSSSGG